MLLGECVHWTIVQLIQQQELCLPITSKIKLICFCWLLEDSKTLTSIIVGVSFDGWLLVGTKCIHTHISQYILASASCFTSFSYRFQLHLIQLPLPASPHLASASSFTLFSFRFQLHLIQLVSSSFLKFFQKSKISGFTLPTSSAFSDILFSC